MSLPALSEPTLKARGTPQRSADPNAAVLFADNHAGNGLERGDFLALAAPAGGFVISRVALEATVTAVTRTMLPELVEFVQLSAPAADWRVAVFLLGGAFAATVLFGLAPALQATRIELVRTMRGEVTRDGRPGRARNALIGVQVTAAALLLICSAVFLRSAFASATADPGMRTSYTVIIEMVNEPLRELMLAAVARDPHVAKVAAAAPGTMSRPRGAFASRSAADPNQVRVGYQFVSPEYFDVLDIRILHGRGFTQAEASGGAAVTIVSETIARQRWPNGNAVGQILHLDPGTSVIVDPPGGRSGKCPPARCSWSACLATCPASESASSPKRRTSTGRRRRSLRRRT